ncbi:MAG: D-isomer specific 2-hydroxyacid dehydrogenase NAD-binding protein [Candidatus Giovannonibacteria bacterium GW2011_GWA1_44_25]|uniref:D-isomer specific 2-hydroxyacid dehydrogenase NAD-binding protein n=1 Tax=Candidatus Giovannonibacteria bacterium GW2011_GWA1_44_25 TaxID=1618645 RepID=A0A0G1IHY3_9BACT|nr:MAG: D-isomer specific 2-hydroxyacid dehydrogenase NAD-binding protein [Candidatus Giovannonibacteria bacterium GW2011_GWA1_44_25]
MKIAVLNECFLNENHLKRLKALGDVEIFNDTTTEEQAIERLKGVDVAIWDGFICAPTAKILETTNTLKLIVLPHTGYFMVDLETANKKGVKVANAPGFSKEAVAEMVIGLMFAVNRKIPLMDRDMRENPFESDPGNKEMQDRYWGFDIKGKTMGILGLGRIGSTVATLALGIGMKVIANNRSPKTMDGVEMMSKEEVLKKADVVSINVTSGAETEQFISEEELSLMRPAAILINVDQGKMVDTEALYKALSKNKIAGAGLDQVVGLTKDHPILKLDNVVFTPHAGSSTNESFRENLPELVVSAVEGFVGGTSKNLIN